VARGGAAVTDEVFAQARYPMPEGLERHAWYSRNADGEIAPIGRRLPNPQGLHDLYGNAWEVMNEPYSSPQFPGQVGGDVLMGGGIHSADDELRADARVEVQPYDVAGDVKTADTGFRVVLAAPVAGRPPEPGAEPEIGPTGHTQKPQKPQDVPAETPERKEAALGLTAEDRRKISGQLDRLGFDLGPPPGGRWFGVQNFLSWLGIGQGPDLFGERARDALAAFQKARNLEASGFVTAETRESLRLAIVDLMARELAEAERRAERERLAEQARMAEMARQAELERQTQLAHQAAVERQAQRERLAGQARMAEMEKQAELERRAEKKRQALLASLDVFLPMIKLPGGVFLMGCSPGDGQCEGHEQPVHKVTVHSFRIGKFNVTQAQWQKIMGVNPSLHIAEDGPVDSVSWNDAQEFLKRLNAKAPGKPYRLPTEAEWEYAARGGAQTDYCSECAKLSKGNVWEWVQDCYHDSFIGAPSDSSEWREEACLSARRVQRGGFWSDYPGGPRVSLRHGVEPGRGGFQTGLRLAQDL
jgi:formylglycine-generating enzyme required for sulfatase activity